MPTIIRRTETVAVTDKRSGVFNAVGWQVTSSLWTPPTDVYETEEKYFVRIEAAGMREADFEITFDKGILLVKGIRNDVPERRGYHQMEIHFGKFTASIGIPGAIDLDTSMAEYHDGFLIISMPKLKTTEVKIEE
jgi:HSP20 family protein